MVIPQGLSAKTRKIWSQIEENWELEPGFHYPLLMVALEAYDMVLSCQRRIKKEGMMQKTPTGFSRVHPLLRVLHDSTTRFLSAWTKLNLDIEPPQDVGRPTENNMRSFSYGEKAI